MIVQGPRDVKSLSFTPDSKYLVSVAFDSRLSVWNREGLLLKTFSERPGTFSGVAVNPDGKHIASWGSDTIFLWDMGGSLFKKLKAPRFSQVVSLSFSPDGKHIAAGYGDRQIVLWSTDGAALRTFGAHADAITSVAFSPDGRSIASASKDKKIRLWDFKGKLVATFEGHSGGVNSVAFGRGGKQLVSGSDDGTIRLWDLSGKLVRTIPNYPLQKHAVPDKGVTVDPSLKPLQVKSVAFRTGRDQVYSVDLVSVKVWGAEGNLIHATARPPGSASAVSFSPDGRYVAYDTAFTNNFFVEDLDGKFIRDFSNKEVKMPQPFFIPDGRHVIAGRMLFGLDGKLIKSFDAAPYAFALTQDGRYILAGTDKKIVIFGVASERVLSVFDGHSEVVSSLALSPDDKYFVSGGHDGAVRLWDINGDPIRTFEGRFGNIGRVAFSPDGKHVAAASQDKRIGLWNIGGNLLGTFTSRTDLPAHLLAFTPDGKNIVAGDEVWSLGGELVRRTEWDSSWRKGYAGSPESYDGQYRVDNEQGAVRLTSVANGESFSLLSDGTEWLMYTPDGYFDASPQGGRFVAMVKGLDAYGIDQFAARYNRPDLILERMGLGTTEQIGYYNSLYQRRLKKLGLTEAALSSELHAPEARIIGVKQDGKFAEVAFSLTDSKSTLKRYNMYVNGVPVFGSMGREINVSTLAGSDMVELTSGKNRIELSVMNRAGTESLRALAYAEYRGKEKGELYFLAFGASKYKNAQLNLNYADKDVSDLAAAVSKMRPAYANVRTKLFLNSEVTAANIRKAKDFLKDAKTDDTVVLAIAGHGVYSRDDEAKYYFLGYDADLNDIPGTGVDFDAIEGLLDDIKPRRKIFLMDTCESGELDDATYNEYYALAEARGMEPRSYRRPVNASGAGSERDRAYLYGKDRFIYNNLARRTGAVVFSSSKGGEMSYESREIRNGFFTRGIINALTTRSADKNNDGKIDSRELLDYVREAVENATGGLQHPGIDRDNLYQTISLPLITN